MTGLIMLLAIAGIVGGLMTGAQCMALRREAREALIASETAIYVAKLAIRRAGGDPEGDRPKLRVVGED